MKNILDMLFLKNVKLDKSVFRNMYYSSDKSSFAGMDLNILSENKKYDKYEILKDILKDIGECHQEYMAFIKLKDKTYFIRILKDNDQKIYDILMYLINDSKDLKKYDSIFFKDYIKIPKELEDINKTIIYINNHINIIKNAKYFTSYLGYEDWDYKNKCLNMIDVSLTKNVIDDFKNQDFINVYEFVTNGKELIKLKIEFKYLLGFYYIENIEKMD